MLDKLKRIYGKETPITVMQEKIHDRLGMIIEGQMKATLEQLSISDIHLLDLYIDICVFGRDQRQMFNR